VDDVSQAAAAKKPSMTGQGSGGGPSVETVDGRHADPSSRTRSPLKVRL
jgi:hypothetical protein